MLELYVARSVPSGWFVVIQSGWKLLKYFGRKITIKLCGKFIEYAWSNSQSIRWSYLSPKSIFENKFQKTNSSYAVLRFHLFQFEHKKMLNSSWNIYVRFDKLGGGYLINRGLYVVLKRLWCPVIFYCIPKHLLFPCLDYMSLKHFCINNPKRHFPDQIFFSWYVPVYHTGTASIFGMHRNRRKTNISESQIQVHSFWTQNTLMRFSSTT